MAGHSRLSAVGNHVIASVAAENLDGGVGRERGEFAQPFHFSTASLATARGAVLIRRIGRNVPVARRHDGRPSRSFPNRWQSACHIRVYSTMSAQLKLVDGRGLPEAGAILLPPPAVCRSSG